MKHIFGQETTVPLTGKFPATPRNSAMEYNKLEQIMSNELVRRLSRCHPEIEECENPVVINSFEEKLRWSGYNRMERRKIMNKNRMQT